MANQICFVFNMAPKYNEELYARIDKAFSSKFIIGEKRDDIKEMDFDLLSNYYTPKHIKLFRNIAYERGVLKQIRKSGSRVVITTLEPYNITLWLMKLYCFLSHRRLYYWTHGWYGKETGIKRIIKKLDYKTVSGFLLYGNYAKKLMLLEGFEEKKLHVIHNSLNYSKQVKLRSSLKPTTVYKDYFKNDNPVLLFIGRLTKVKSLDMLLKAVSKLKDNGEEYNVCFVGDGTEKAKLQLLSQKLNLEGRVWFYGACYDEQENAQMIYNADVCVAPGNVGLTAMHSMVFGCPVITHDNFAWQMPEFESIYEGTTGAFFHQGSIESLVNTISQWFINHRNDREDVREACYYEIDNYWTPEYEIKVLKTLIDNENGIG